MLKRMNKQQVREAFAKRFRLALKEAGYELHQQKEIGELFGISGPAVRKWWEGTALPASTRIKEVADTLGVERAWLQDGEGLMRPVAGKVENPGVRYGQDILLSHEEADLIRAYRSLPPKMKGVARQIISLLQPNE